MSLVSGSMKAKRKYGKNVAFIQARPQIKPVMAYSPRKKATTERRVCCTV